MNIKKGSPLHKLHRANTILRETIIVLSMRMDIRPSKRNRQDYSIWRKTKGHLDACLRLTDEIREIIVELASRQKTTVFYHYDINAQALNIAKLWGLRAKDTEIATEAFFRFMHFARRVVDQTKEDINKTGTCIKCQTIINLCRRLEGELFLLENYKDALVYTRYWTRLRLG